MVQRETTLCIEVVLDSVFERCAGQPAAAVEATLSDLAAHAHPPLNWQAVELFAQAISAGHRIDIRWRRGHPVWTLDQTNNRRATGSRSTSDSPN
jgi:hypothetical protein